MPTLVNNCCQPQTLKVNSTTGYLSISDGNSVFLGTLIKSLGITTPVVDFQINGFIITLTYVDNSGIIQHKNIDLAALAQGGNITVSDTSSLNLTYSGANLSGDVSVSAIAGNSIIIRTDGLWAPVFTETVLTANDSSTIDFTTSGTSNHTLTAAVKISTTAGNKVQVVGDGLLVADMTTYILPGANISMTGTGSASDPKVISATAGAETPLSVNDSSSLHFVSSGTFGHTLTGNVKVSTVVANALTINSDGLYVPQATSGTYTDAQARAAISVIAPLLYNNTTGVISLAQATTTTSGYLANSDWNTFNAKISTGASIGTGSSLPVYAGQNSTTLNFNGLRAGSNITLNQVGNDIVISAASGGGGGGSSTFNIDFIVGDGGSLTPTANASQFNPSSNPLAGKTVLGVWVEGTKIASVPRTGGALYFIFNQVTGTITLTNGVFSDDTYYSILYR